MEFLRKLFGITIRPEQPSDKVTTVKTNLYTYNADMSILGKLLDEFKHLGPYLFFYGFRDENTVMAVIKEIPYCTIDLPYIDCKTGTKVLILPIEEPSSGQRFYALVTGGNLNSQEARQVQTICERNNPIKDRRIVVTP